MSDVARESRGSKAGNEQVPARAKGEKGVWHVHMRISQSWCDPGEGSRECREKWWSWRSGGSPEWKGFVGLDIAWFHLECSVKWEQVLIENVHSPSQRTHAHVCTCMCRPEGNLIHHFTVMNTLVWLSCFFETGHFPGDSQIQIGWQPLTDTQGFSVSTSPSLELQVWATTLAFLGSEDWTLTWMGYLPNLPNQPYWVPQLWLEA